MKVRNFRWHLTRGGMLKWLGLVIAISSLVTWGFTPAPQESEKVTILLWDEFTEEQETIMEEMLERFMEANPEIEVKREVHPIDETRDIISTALASGTGPDVFMFDAGPASAGVLAKAGLLLPLDEAYEEFGWNERVFEWTKSRVTFDGKIYGIANFVGFLGVYYNKTIFEELGVEPPKTQEELEAICEKAKEAGYIPMFWANKPGWPATNIFSELANNALGPEEMDKVIWEHESWDRPELVKVIQMFFVDMQEKGYFPEGLNQIDYAEGNEIFYQGNSAMYPTGSWMMGPMSTKPDFEVGFFFYPSIEGKPIYPPGGVESAYFVSASSKNPEAALKLLKFLYEPEQIPDWLRIGYFLPVDMTAGLEETEVSPLVEFALQTVTEASAGAGFGYNIDVITPAKFNDVMYTGFQAVVAGDKTPEEQIKEMQAAWKEAIEAGEVLSR